MGSKHQKEHRPNQPSVHHTHVLCVAAASALPADPEGAQEPPALPMGSICDAVQFICGPHLSSIALQGLTVGQREASFEMQQLSVQLFGAGMQEQIF